MVVVNVDVGVMVAGTVVVDVVDEHVEKSAVSFMLPFIVMVGLLYVPE